mmetsp:Transcript_14914/g.26263  ORF Transcript_14914/g.26263 Transcript_14914/m.26263 type:complete len:96 (+) Transcript_14914:60-347(+)
MLEKAMLTQACMDPAERERLTQEVGDSSNTARTQANTSTVSTPGSTRISTWSTPPKGSVEHLTDANGMPPPDLMLNWRLSVSPSMIIIVSPSLVT